MELAPIAIVITSVIAAVAATETVLKQVQCSLQFSFKAGDMFNNIGNRSVCHRNLINTEIGEVNDLLKYFAFGIQDMRHCALFKSNSFNYIGYGLTALSTTGLNKRHRHRVDLLSVFSGPTTPRIIIYAAAHN